VVCLFFKKLPGYRGQPI